MVSAPGSYGEALGLIVEADGAGAPLLRLPFGDHLLGRPGFLHGGMVAGLLEMAAMATLRHALGDADARPAVATVTVDYLRGGLGIETRAAARAIRIGRRVANLEAQAWQEDRDRPIATARINLLIRRKG